MNLSDNGNMQMASRAGAWHSTRLSSFSLLCSGAVCLQLLFSGVDCTGLDWLQTVEFIDVPDKCC